MALMMSQRESMRANTLRSFLFSRTFWQTIPIIVALPAMGLCTLVADPRTPGHWPLCPVYAATGHYCPGCGSLRATRSLMSGDFIAAARFNPLLLLAIVWVAWYVSTRLVVYFRPIVNPSKLLTWLYAGPPASARFCYGLLVVLATFTVLRNLPGSF